MLLLRATSPTQYRAEGRSETAQLLQALGDMQNALITLVSNVHQGAEAVSTHRQRLRRATVTCLHAPKAKASSLERRPLPHGRLNSTVRQKRRKRPPGQPDGARCLNGLPCKGSSGERRGSDHEGNQRKFEPHGRSDIIGVIDSIAFQTNILP